MTEGRSKKKKYYWLIIAILVLILIVAWVIATREVGEEPVSEETQESEEGVDTSSWETHENEEFGFSFKYPKG